MLFFGVKLRVVGEIRMIFVIMVVNELLDPW